MRRRPAVVALLALCGAASGAAPLRAQDALVLSGGGGRGIAHAGVLVALAERGHSPDIVVGTSMGSIVGALYAAGYAPDSIAALFLREDWRAVFAPDALTVGHARTTMRPLLSFGVGGDGVMFGGLVPDAGINRRLVELLFDAGARARGDFDRLPRRYRAVTADLRDGSAVSLGSGDLARAVRASMAVPGAFSPIVIDQRTLVDGGIADNLPITEARALGARHVIASDVLLPELEKMPTSRVAIGIRALRLLIENAAPDGPPPDVLVTPRIPEDVSAATFPADTRPLVEAGYEAARTALPARVPPAAPPPAPAALERVAERIIVEGSDARLEGLVRAAFAPVVGDGYDAGRVVRRVSGLYATRMFRGVWPRVEERDGEPTLVVRVEPVPASIFALGAGWDDRRRARGLLALRQRMRLLGAAEFRASAQAHRFLRTGSLEIARPFAARPALSLDAGAHYADRDVPRFVGDSADIGIERMGGWAGLDWRTPDGRYGLSLHWSAEHIAYAGIDGASTGPSLRFTEVPPYPRVAGVPFLLDLGYRFGDVPYARMHARGSLAHGFGPLRVALVGDVAASERAAPPDALFALGDVDALPWLATGALRGTRRAIVGADVAYRVFLDGAVRLRMRAGAAGSTAALEDLDAWRAGVEVGAIWPTPFGVLAGGFAVGDRSETRFTLDLGTTF